MTGHESITGDLTTYAVHPTNNDVASTAGDGSQASEKNLTELLAALHNNTPWIESGFDYDSAAGLVATFNGGEAIIDGHRVICTGTFSFTLEASSTNHVWISWEETADLATNLTVYNATSDSAPSTPSVKIATVTTDGSGVTANTDERRTDHPLGFPTTTKGDLVGHDGSTPVRVAIGANGTVPTADSGETAGWSWQTPAKYVDPSLSALGAQSGATAGWKTSTWGYQTAFGVSGQDSSMYAGIWFSDDGTKMFTFGNANKAVYEYALSTAWSISTASYTDSFSVSSQISSAEALAFSDDGTKMYCKDDNAEINQYTLSTAWDVSTASFDSKTYTPSEDNNLKGMAFGDSGTKLYTWPDGSDTCYQYNLSTAWDISTASYSTNSLSLGSTSDNDIQGAFESSTKVWHHDTQRNNVAYRTLSTAWDISSAGSETTVSLSFSPSEDASFFSPDGQHFYILGGNTVYEYDAASLSAAETTIDLSTAGVFSLTVQSEGCNLTFSNASAVQAFRLEVTNGNTGTVTWPTSVDWASGSAPTLTTTGTDILEFFTRDSGTTWYGRVLVLNAS